MAQARSTTTQDAAVRLMLKFPYWSSLYYSMTVYDEATIPTLCTDGRNMWVNPEFWRTLDLDRKISALAHEVGHKMLLHCSRRGHRHPQLWNMAADYVVNGILVDNGFKLGEYWLYNPEYKGMAVEAVYNILEKQALRSGNGGDGQGENQAGEEGEAQGQGSGDQEGDGEADGNSQGAGGNSVTVPGVPKEWAEKWQDIKEVTGTKESVDKYEKEIIDQVQKAIMTAKAHGSAPAGMEAFDEVCKPSKEPWYNHLHRYMQSLSMSEYRWERINRRHLVQHQIFTPDNYSEALTCVVFMIDCSGSVFDAASQANFAGHVNAIMAETKPKRTHIVYFDSRVTKHEELEYGALDFTTRPKGGGGTDFRPCFRFLEEEGIVPEVCIVLTDCYGNFPNEEPPYPTVWASIIDPARLGHYAPPFGDVIFVDPED